MASQDSRNPQRGPSADAPPVRARASPGAILRLRCPVCWTGAMFASPLRMNGRCPHCDWQFDRGNGYFIGAMYSSYGLSLGLSLSLAGLLWLAGWSVWPIVWACGAAIAILGPLVIFPLSRLLWIWVEREGWLHDGQEDVDTLRRAHMQRGGLPLPPADGGAAPRPEDQP